ncbi:hypothetical protein [Ekhidna sp.]|uniref:hypothetical protein n=1 Tax=Ekhidna sp. TaxID=2608089 RepID=UPI003B50E747
MKKLIIISINLFIILVIVKAKMSHTPREKYISGIEKSDVSHIDLDEPWPFTGTLSKVDPNVHYLLSIYELK